jgi:quinol monooxygenase YgiN
VICYLIKTTTKPYKNDEFMTFVNSLSPKILKEKGCIGFNLYSGSQEENTFVVIGEWNTQVAMGEHFQKENFEILIGSVKVLGETMDMNISEVIETGGFKLAKEYITSPRLVENSLD